MDTCLFIFLHPAGASLIEVGRIQLYGYLVITDSFPCPWGNKAPAFSRKFTPLNTDTPL